MASFLIDLSIALDPSVVEIARLILVLKLVVSFAFTVLSLRLILQSFGYSRALILGLKKPSAVPLVLSASEQAIDQVIDRAISMV